MIGLKTLYAMLAGAFGGTARPETDKRMFRPSVRRSEFAIGYLFTNVPEEEQRTRLLNAQAKRDRRADKLQQSTNQSWNNNYVHHDAFRTLDNLSGFIEPLRLNPFYVAK
jgi:hypothetical protein